MTEQGGESRRIGRRGGFGETGTEIIADYVPSVNYFFSIIRTRCRKNEVSSE